MGLPRQEYWRGLSFPPPGGLPYPGIEPMSPASPALTGGFFTLHTTWEAPLYLSPALIPQVDIISKMTNYPGLPGSWASLVAQTGKNLPAMQETWVRSPGWEFQGWNQKSSRQSETPGSPSLFPSLHLTGEGTSSSVKCREFIKQNFKVFSF